jgi:hypothetical protein
MGVSCPIPNSFACDRVGVAVWLREPALSVDAAIAGREVQLMIPSGVGQSRKVNGECSPVSFSPRV